MGKSSKVPTPPDPAKTIAADEASKLRVAQQTAAMNAVNLYTPWGTSTYARDDKGVPTSQYINLSPGQQTLFDTSSNISNDLANIAQQRVGQIPGDAFTLNGMTELPTWGDTLGYADRVSQAYYDQGSRLMGKQFADDQDRLQQQLYDRGHPMGSGAGYDREVEKLREAQGSTLSGLASQSIAQGIGAAQGLFGIGQAARQQDINDQITQRNQGFNELSAFLQGSPALPMPQAQQLSPVNISPTDVGGITNQAYQNQLAAYQMKQQQQSSLLGGIVSLATSLIGSSRDYKENKHKAPEVLDRVRKLPVETWNYRPGYGDPEVVHIGPYAEDFAEAFTGDGKMINLGDAVGVLFKAVQELADENEKLRDEVKSLKAA